MKIQSLLLRAILVIALLGSAGCVVYPGPSGFVYRSWAYVPAYRGFYSYPPRVWYYPWRSAAPGYYRHNGGPMWRNRGPWRR